MVQSLTALYSYWSDLALSTAISPYPPVLDKRSRFNPSDSRGKTVLHTRHAQTQPIRTQNVQARVKVQIIYGSPTLLVMTSNNLSKFFPESIPLGLQEIQKCARRREENVGAGREHSLWQSVQAFGHAASVQGGPAVQETEGTAR